MRTRPITRAHTPPLPSPHTHAHLSRRARRAQAVLRELASLLSEFEEEIQPVSSFQEAFDALGVLPEVLAQAGDGGVDGFVRAARRS